jgi:hypothetical protein
MMSRHERRATVAVPWMTEKAHDLRVADQRDMSMTAAGHPC